jgi:hypothetical protein
MAYEEKFVDVNNKGDLICPWCFAQHITPSGMIVVPGALECQLCKKKSTVDEATAQKANNGGIE